MNPTAPGIDHQQTPEGVVYAVLGAWTAASLTRHNTWPAVQQQLSAVSQPPAGRWNLLELEQLDHLGAQLLWIAWGRAWPSQIDIAPQQIGRAHV